jgi:hypothetical protein
LLAAHFPFPFLSASTRVSTHTPPASSRWILYYYYSRRLRKPRPAPPYPIEQPNNTAQQASAPLIVLRSVNWGRCGSCFDRFDCDSYDRSSETRNKQIASTSSLIGYSLTD